MRNGPKGEKNVNWKGGIAEYPNHYEMKKNRLIKLQQTKSKCEACGKRANSIHHKDCSADNHQIENLIVLCYSCHSMIHCSEHKEKSLDYSYKPTSKFIRLYGMTCRQMAEKYGGRPTLYTLYHKQGKLKEFLNNLTAKVA